MSNHNLTNFNARNSLAYYLPGIDYPGRYITIPQWFDRVVDACCSICNLNRDKLLSKSKHGPYSEARFIAMIILNEKGASPNLAATLFNRDRCTFYHALKEIENRSRYKEFREKIDRVRKEVDNGC